MSKVPTCQIEAVYPKDGTRTQSTARVRVNATGVSTKIPIKELLSEEWIDSFSGRDIALLATINANDAQIRNVDNQKYRFPYGIVYLTSLFGIMLMATNFIGDSVKIFSFGFLGGFDVPLPMALIFFPLTYCFGACITETYGFVVSRHVIWGAFLVNALVMLVVLFLQKLDLLDGSILGVSHQMFRALTASAIGYFVGELANSFIISRLKVYLKGRRLILRFIAANFVGAVLDSVLFGGLLFWGAVATDVLCKIIVVQVMVKIVYEIMFSVLFSRIVIWIKEKDGVDYFDYKFNPQKG
ncbi:VUT family protein [Burkholderia glumae]|uniref:VUT family protein n=1 Tax=Burkholderia glumae TaxID=337 RepID=UPI002151E8AC|nr:VUT family protein [Burkholderia glumae]